MVVDSFVAQSGIRTFSGAGTFMPGQYFLIADWMPNTSAADGSRLLVVVMICGAPFVQLESAANHAPSRRPTA